MLPLACVLLPSRQCQVLLATCQPLPSWRAAVALPRRFGRVCWARAALRRGAGRRVPLPIRIAGSTGNSCHAIAGRDPHDVERRRGSSHASEESSYRRLARGRMTAFFTLWKLAALCRAAQQYMAGYTSLYISVSFTVATASMRKVLCAHSKASITRRSMPLP